MNAGKKGKGKGQKGFGPKGGKGGSMPMEIGQVHQEEWPASEGPDMSFSFGSVLGLSSEFLLLQVPPGCSISISSQIFLVPSTSTPAVF